MNVWIGTSGYSYPDWLGDFYPSGTRSEKLLGIYCQHFPLVELNFTFYRPPTALMLDRIAAKTPPGFQFLVKVPQTISHQRSPNDLPGFRKAAERLLDRGQLLGVLLQFPQSTHCTAEAVKWLQTLAHEMRGLRPAVEFRHRSWSRPGLPAWLATQGLDLVAVDVPDVPALFPRGWVQSGPRAYLRLHSRDAAKWYGGEKERYDYQYNDAQLSEWIGSMRAAESGTRETLVLFNNCQRTQAVGSAQRMRDLVGQQAPQFHVVAPLAHPPERTLFDPMS